MSGTLYHPSYYTTYTTSTHYTIHTGAGLSGNGGGGAGMPGPSMGGAGGGNNGTGAGNGTGGGNGAGSGNVILSASTGLNWTNSPITYSVGTGNTTQAGISVKGDAEFDGDVKLKGRSLEKILDGIEKRLAVLVPNPKKLEKFEALKKAYDHYKLLEALCHEDDKNE